MTFPFLLSRLWIKKKKESEAKSKMEFRIGNEVLFKHISSAALQAAERGIWWAGAGVWKVKSLVDNQACMGRE